MNSSGFLSPVEQKEFLVQLFHDQGLSLSSEQASRFILFYERLVEKNKVMNLTAITEFQEVCIKHFLDSVMLLKTLPELLQSEGEEREALRLIDVGTGAGFPGLPLKIMLPDTEILLLDALQKRIDFLKETAEACGLSKIGFLHERAEDGAQTPKERPKFPEESSLRESFDLAVSRAVAYLPVLLEYCLPYVRTGGLFVSYKSGKISDELEQASNALEVLGGVTEKIDEFTLPDGSGRSLILFRKVRETPDQYPRRAKKIEKSPL